MREKFIAGNWKMHTTSADAARPAKAIANGVGTGARIGRRLPSLSVCPGGDSRAAK